MPQEDIETCKRAVEAYNRRDVDAFVEEFDPAVEWRPLNQLMFGREAGVYRGHEGVRRFMQEVDEALAEVQIEEVEIHDLGERIVMSGQLRAFGKASGAPTESPIGWLIEMKDARIARMRDYLDPAEALRAAENDDWQ
jgi:ketosteroid isomerase-like protein